MHTRTYARTHARTHAHTHTHTHSSDHLIVLMNIVPLIISPIWTTPNDEVSLSSSCCRAQVHLLSCVIWSQSYPLLLVQTACPHEVMSTKGCSLFSHGHVRGSSTYCTPGYTHLACEWNTKFVNSTRGTSSRNPQEDVPLVEFMYS